MNLRLRVTKVDTIGDGEVVEFAPVQQQLPEHAGGMPKDDDGNDTHAPVHGDGHALTPFHRLGLSVTFKGNFAAQCLSDDPVLAEFAPVLEQIKEKMFAKAAEAAKEAGIELPPRDAFALTVVSVNDLSARGMFKAGVEYDVAEVDHGA